jgi:hypothetical protein
MGFDRSDIEEIRQLRRQRAAGGDETAFRKFFRRDLHAGLVRNMRKVGVLTSRVAPDLEGARHLARGGVTASLPAGTYFIPASKIGPICR